MTIDQARATRLASTHAHYRARRPVALAALAAAQFLVVLDASIVNIAMPSISAQMQVGPGIMPWVVTSYVLAFGGLLMLGGRLGDRYGHRLVFLVGVAGFMLASVMAALSSGIEMLLVARPLQGLSAALLAPAALALLMKLFPVGDGRAQAISVWGAVAGIGGVTGAVLGGFLTSTFGWAAIFYINVPVCLAVVALVPFAIARDEGRQTEPLDVSGAVTITAGVVLLVAALSLAHELGFAAWPTLGCALLGLGLLGIFVRVEQTHAAPLVPLSIFTHRTVLVGNLVMLIIGGVTLAFFYTLSLQMQVVFGHSALETGAMQVPLTLALLVTTMVMPAATARLGSLRALAIAMIVMALGLGWLGLAPADATFIGSVLGPLILIGIGLGGAFTAATALAVDGISVGESGVVSGLINTSQQIGGALILAIAVTLATSVTAAQPPEQFDDRLALNAGYAATYACLTVLCVLAVLIACLSLRKNRIIDL